MPAREPDVLAFNVGGTRSAVMLGNAAGRIALRQEWHSRVEQGPAAMIEVMAARGREVLATAPADAASCGIAIGGPLDVRTGVIHGPPNLPGWDDVPLRSEIERALGLPTRVEHDATACALAEVRWGGLDQARRLAYLTCGTGFGVGFAFDGEPYYGAHGHPPDIGNIRLWDDGPKGYGKPGTIEGFCAASALGRIAAWRFPSRWVAPPEPEDVAGLAAGGDADAVEVVEISAAAVGRAAAVVADLLHTDVIVLGSLARYLGDSWVQRVGATFAETAHVTVRDTCRVQVSALGPAVQDLAAVAAGLRALEQPGSGTRTDA